MSQDYSVVRRSRQGKTQKQLSLCGIQLQLPTSPDRSQGIFTAVLFPGTVNSIYSWGLLLRISVD